MQPRRILPAACLLILAAGPFALRAAAQTPATVTLTASHLTLGDGYTLLPAGDQVCVLATDLNDNPFSYRVGASSGITTASGSAAVCPTLTTAGTLPSGFIVLNSAASAIGPACLRITEMDPINGEINRLTCVQTGTPAALTSWCSIAGGVETCNLDQYQPSVPSPPVPQPSSTSGALNVAGALSATSLSVSGAAAFSSAVTFATGQTFPGTAVLAASSQAFTGTGTTSFAGPVTATAINTASTPGPVYAVNKHAQLNQTGGSVATSTLASTDCGDVHAYFTSVGHTVTLPAISTLPANCTVHMFSPFGATLTLNSATANITSSNLNQALVSTLTIPPMQDFELEAFSTGWAVESPSGAQLSIANAWTAPQTFGTGTATAAMNRPDAGINLNAICNGSGCAPTLPVFPGLTVFGDSAADGYSPVLTQNLASPYWSTLGFAWLMAPDFGGTYTNYGWGGDQAPDLTREWLYPNLAPGSALAPADQRNPTVTIAIGGNDAQQCQTFPACTQRFTQTVGAAVAWAAIPASYKVVGQSSAITKTGTWTADNFAALSTFSTLGSQPGITGVATSTATLTGSPSLSIPITTTVANQSVYVAWRVFTTGVTGGYSSGSAALAIDGSATDTLSSLLNYGTGHGTLDTIYLRQYQVATAGSHTLTITPSAVPFSFVWAGTVPQSMYQAGQPSVLLAGIAKQISPSTATDTYTGNYDTAAQAIVAAFQADGMQVAFAPVRSYINTSTDINTTDGVHPNALGYQHARDAFEYAVLASVATNRANAGQLRSCGTVTATPTVTSLACTQVTPQSKCSIGPHNASATSAYITSVTAGTVSYSATTGAIFDLSCSAK